MTDPAAAARTRRTDYIREFDGDPGPPPARESGVVPSYDAHVDRAVTDAVWSRPRGDGILYLGMNEGSAALELRALRAATNGQVTAVLGHAGAKVDTKFGTFDLAVDAQVHDFAQKLVVHYGLPANKAAAIETLLIQTKAAGRDEVARIALYMARAESGRGDMPSRLVLSGHSAGGDMWGDRTGEFNLLSVAKLGQLFPTAAGQIEDIHFAGCFTTWELQSHREEWRHSFPNLKTMWGYDGHSELAPVGDLLAWQAATTGHKDRIDIRTIADHPHVNVWSSAGGLLEPLTSEADLRVAAKDADARFAGYLSGRDPVHHASQAWPQSDYDAYARLAARGDTDAGKKAEMMLRVRFYEQSIRGHFASAYGAEVRRGFEALGLPAPDFAQLSRAEAMSKIADFQRAAAMHPNVDASHAAKLVYGLANLDAEIIPSGWCR